MFAFAVGHGGCASGIDSQGLFCACVLAACGKFGARARERPPTPPREGAGLTGDAVVAGLRLSGPPGGRLIRQYGKPQSRHAGCPQKRLPGCTVFRRAAIAGLRQSAVCGKPESRRCTSTALREHGTTAFRLAWLAASAAFRMRGVPRLAVSGQCALCGSTGLTARRIAAFTALRLCGAAHRAPDRRARP